MEKADLLSIMNALDFAIADIGLMGSVELVAKRCADSRIIWWAIEVEGSGFVRLFRGSIRRAIMKESEAVHDHIPISTS